MKPCVCSLSLKHPAGRLLGAGQCNLVRRLQRVPGVHGEEPEPSGVPRHGGPVWHHHQLHADVSLCSIDGISFFILYIHIYNCFVLSSICCCVAEGRCWSTERLLPLSGAGKLVSIRNIKDRTQDYGMDVHVLC